MAVMFYGLQQQTMLKIVHPGCQRFGGIAGIHRDGGLAQYVPLIILCRDQVDGGSGYRVTRCQYGGVYVQSVEALAAMSGQQGRMYVNDAIFVSGENERTKFLHVTREDHEIRTGPGQGRADGSIQSRRVRVGHG